MITFLVVLCISLALAMIPVAAAVAIGRGGETLDEYEVRITREHAGKLTSTLEQHRRATENAPIVRLPR